MGLAGSGVPVFTLHNLKFCAEMAFRRKVAGYNNARPSAVHPQRSCTLNNSCWCVFKGVVVCVQCASSLTVYVCVCAREKHFDAG